MIVSDATDPIKTFLQKGIVGRPDNTARRYLLFVLNSCERQSISVKVTDIYPVLEGRNQHKTSGRRRKE